MTKRNWLMLILLAGLTAVYVFYFTDWFAPRVLHISSTSRANFSRFRNAAPGGPAAAPVTFSFDHDCRPTEIKVVLLAAWQTNQNVLPVWHLVADTNGAPIKIFTYGQRLRGLKPAIAGSHAEPLQPDSTYRLFVTAGSARGQHDFKTKSAS